MYAQIGASGRCFAVSDFNAPGSIEVSSADVLGKIWTGEAWQDPPQEEQPEQTDPFDDLRNEMIELKEQNFVLMMALAEIYEGGGANG